MTVLFDALPNTVAVNLSAPPTADEAGDGLTVTEVMPEVEGTFELAATVTRAVADFEGSATLVAVILPDPPAAGAVNTPEAEIAPIEAVQVTESFEVVP